MTQIHACSTKPAICCIQTKSLKVVSSTQVINTQTHHLQVLINTMNLSIECPKLAGRVAPFLQNWEVLTQDQWMLQTVAGYQLELTSTLYQTRVPQQIHCSPESKLQITTEVLKLLNKGAIVETQQTPHNFVSQLFLVEKNDGGQRPVINLRSLNQFVKTEHFKMKGLHLLPDLLQSRDWMVKVDLKDLQIPIHPDYHTSSPSNGRRKLTNSNACPLVSRVFTKLLKPVVGFLRQIGCRLIIYLDDILLMHQERDQLEQITQLISQMLESLGLTVNRKKSILIPTQKLEFLGFHLCSMTMRLSVPSEKLRKIQQDARKMLHQASVSVREIARFVGKTTATLRAIPLVPLHYRALQMQMNLVLPLTYNQEEISDKYNTVLPLNTASKEDLRWWETLPTTSTGAPIHPPDPSIIVHSDVSNQGWGAVLNGQSHKGVYGHQRRQPNTSITWNC